MIGQNKLNTGLKTFESAMSGLFGEWEIVSNVRDSDFTWYENHANLGSLIVLYNCCEAPFKGRRGKTRSSNDSDSDITLMLVTQGSFSMSQGQGKSLCSEGSMILFDNGRPIDSEQFEATKTISVGIPSKYLVGKYQDIREYCGISINSSAGYPFLLKNFLCSLWAGRNGFTHQEPNVVPEILNELIYPSFCDSTADLPDSMAGASYRKRAMRIVHDHLESPELSPNFIAESLGISVSYLYTLFRHTDLTLNKLIIEGRLKRCRDHLSSHMHNDLSVTEIAFNTGFRDLSHFSRRFKTRFGKSPREFRQIFKQKQKQFLFEDR